MRKKTASLRSISRNVASGEASDRLPRHGLARVLSRMGVCSRSEAVRRIVSGRVRVNGKVVRDPGMPADAATDRIEMDGVPLQSRERVCIVVNKPRGLVVSASDERGRDTVYALLRDARLPWLAPVGRLDMASEGLLLLSNDPVWAARLTDPGAHVAKTYRVQVRGLPDQATLERLRAGVVDRGERLAAESVQVIGGGVRNAWLEVVLVEGRNRQIRRMLAACGHDVLRLMRVAIGPLELGALPKGGWRALTDDEIHALSGA
ncbi:MAG TPA: pseudouridine synthase [Rhodanobacteraceae bacterium]|jgi:23S rRNA pseudouridine2605 synthase|nr:pseudouridine synthase [Rhodanobacteraceae bacterium]